MGEWLTQNRHSGDKNTNQIEEISTKNLDIVTSTLQRVLVFQYGSESAETQFTMSILEKLDDRCSFRSIHFVQHKVHEFDTKLILYRNNIPIVFKGNLKEEAAIEEWINTQIKNNEKKKAYDLMSFINESKNLLVIFYKRVKEEEIYVIEKIMSECRRNDILALKITDDQILKEFNVTSNLKIIFYEDTIAQEYRGEHNLSKILIWINGKVTVEEIDELVATNKYVAVFFFDKNDDSDLAYWDSEVLQQTFKRNNIIAVKNDNIEEARLYGLEEFSSILMFIKKVPRRFKGEMTPEEILDWTLIESGLMKLEKKNSMFPFVEAKDTQIKPTDKEETKNKNDKNDQEETKNKITTIKNENNVVSLFYETKDKISEKLIQCLKKAEIDNERKEIEFSRINVKEVENITLRAVPSLVYFKNGVPSYYEGNLLNEEAIKNWIDDEFKSNQDVIEDLSLSQIQDAMIENTFLLVFIYRENDTNCDESLKQLEQIDDDTEAVGVRFFKSKDVSFIKEYGIDTFPSIIYFEESLPSIYEGDTAEETELLTWVLYQMKEDTIENINRELFTKMMNDMEFLAVFFYDDNEDSKKVLRHIELIDSEAFEFGVKFEGDLLDEEEVLDWLTDPNIMEISDQIEKVNKKMFEKLILRNENLVVFFYSDTDCKQCQSVLSELENIDDDAETVGVPIVKLEDIELAKTVGVFTLPSIVFFRNFGNERIIYTGDVKKEENILEWMILQKDPDSKGLEEITEVELFNLLKNNEAVAVLIVDKNCVDCETTLSELENIEEDVKKQKILFAKTTDSEFAASNGLENLPALIFFKNKIPNLYEGDLNAGEEVFNWLIEMKVESHIELVTRPMLEIIVTKAQYLAVLFYKQNCRTCDQIIKQIENINSEC